MRCRWGEAAFAVSAGMRATRNAWNGAIDFLIHFVFNNYRRPRRQLRICKRYFWPAEWRAVNFSFHRSQLNLQLIHYRVRVRSGRRECIEAAINACYRSFWVCLLAEPAIATLLADYQSRFQIVHEPNAAASPERKRGSDESVYDRPFIGQKLVHVYLEIEMNRRYEKRRKNNKILMLKQS